MITGRSIAWAVAIAIGGTYGVAPALRPHLLLEDHFLEHATAALFAVAAIVGVARFRRDTPLAYLLIPGFALVGAVDEIGFGSRWSNPDLPVVRGIEIDGAHDAFAVVYDVFETRKPQYLAAYAALALASAAGTLWFVKRHDRVRRLGREHPPLAYFSAAVVLVSIALVLDLDLVELPLLVLLEELLELEAALFLLFGALAIGRRPRSDGARVALC